MSSVYPTAILTTTDIPTASPSATLAASNHTAIHNNLRDEVIAVETVLGTTASAVNTSVNYKLANVTGGDRAIGASQTVTVTNKTLSTGTKMSLGSDATGDTYYNSGSGTVGRLGIGSTGQVMTVTGGVPTWASPTSANTNYITDTGAVNALVATLSPALGAYAAGVLVQVKVANTNTGATTINVNALGAKTIKKGQGTTDLVAGDIVAGQVISLEYDGTNFQLQSPSALALNSNGDGSSLTNIPVYAVNTDLTNTFYTFEIPIQPSSGSAVPGWTVAGGFTGASGGAGYARFFDAATTILISNPLPGTTSTASYGYNKIIRFKTRVKFEDTSDIKGFGICTTAANIYSAQTDTTNGEIRFVLNGATLYAQNANGTATSTDITSGITVTNWNVYEFVFTPGVDIKFYVNGSLKATHTTNLPSSGTGLIAIGSSTNGRAINITHPTISLEM